MGAWKKSAGDAGYDQEEAYFYKREMELIEKMRKRPNLRLIQGGKSESRDTDKVAVDTDDPEEKNGKE